jgi:hypothetical protein
MKKNFLLLLILLLASSTFGQKNSFDALTLNLTALKSQVLPLEPVPFGLTLENKTDATINMETSLSFAGGGIRLEIKKPDGKVVVPPQNTFVSGRTIIFPKDVLPGEKMESTQSFEFKIQDYFGTAGAYKVRATLSNKDGKTVRSEWVGITVEEPTLTDKTAYEYLKKKLDGHAQNFLPFTAWNSEELEEFALQNPGTTYTNYARYTLGRRYFDYEKERAEREFRQIQDPNFFYAREVGEKLKKLEQEKNKDQ